MLVNNIDLKVEDMTTHDVTLPFILNPDLALKRSIVRSGDPERGIDNINNVEKISRFQGGGEVLKVTVTHSGGLPNHPAPSPQLVSLVMNGIAPVPPVITGLAKSPVSGQYLLTFTADPGAYLTIQTSTDLINWTAHSSVFVEQDVNSALVTAGSPSETKRFWRLRRGQ